MVNFFHRTSTFQVYELALFDEKQDLEHIHSKIINLGHRSSLVRFMSLKSISSMW